MEFDFRFLARARAFRAVWLAELISVLGSELSRFGIPIWIYEVTGSASAVSIASAVAFVPRIALGVFAGAVVDRWPPKKALIVAEIGQAAGTLLALLTISLGGALWPVYLGLFITSAFSTIDYPALSAATVHLVERQDLAKANGMIEITSSTGLLLAPLLGGAAYSMIGVSGLIAFDLATFAIGIVFVALATFPRTPTRAYRGNVLSKTLVTETFDAARFILRTPGLASTLMVTTAVNFFFSVSYVLITPMILTLTGHDTRTLGWILAASGGGQLLGGIWIGLTGGPRNQVLGFLTSTVALGLLGPLTIGLSSQPAGWAAGLFATLLLLPVITSTSRTIWQARIPKAMIGRSFAFRRTVSSTLAPLGFLMAGFLADKVFEPLLAPPPGSGFKACFILAGVGIALSGILGFLSPGLRHLQREGRTIR